MSATCEQTIVLKNGETIQGRLILLHRAEYLAQTAGLCLRLTADEIQSVDGETDLRQIASFGHELNCETSHFHEVHSDGGGADWTRTVEVHQGTKPKTSQTWIFGRKTEPMSPEEHRELGQVFASMEYRDQWGRILPMEVEEESDMGWKYRVLFDVPVLPGESFTLTEKKIWPRWSRRENDEWVRRHYIGHTAGTLATVVIRLPAGASYVQIEPEPLWKTTLNNRQVAGWRHYIGADEALMPEVRYRLGD